MDAQNLQPIKLRYGIVGNCEALNHALDTALQVAQTDLSVFITGESGVGKEVIPRLIHDNSQRRSRKYFAINCGSIPEGTIDSELFGHEKGAFTGAIGEHEGYFGAADGGTLFLDEVGELPMSTQARLLRVLESGEYIRVGKRQHTECHTRRPLPRGSVLSPQHHSYQDAGTAAPRRRHTSSLQEVRDGNRCQIQHARTYHSIARS